MATRKSSKPAGRTVKDEEVKSAYHDEVLNWLINNLAEVVADHWGMNFDQMKVDVEKARSSTLQWLDGEAKNLIDGYASGKRSSVGHRFYKQEAVEPSAREAMRLASSRMADVRQRMAEINCSDTFGDATLKTYEVMKRVSRIDTKSVGAGYNQRDVEVRVEAGYVDLSALAFKPESFEFRIEDVSNHKGDSFYETALSKAWDSDSLRHIADAFTPANVALYKHSEQISLWFSVRTGDFTLGEILQELKELSVLEKKDQAVALVVDGIDPGMRRNIEHEGFVVVDRDEYERS